jgi:hypothetical protein
MPSSNLKTEYSIVVATSDYLKRHLAKMYALAEDYHKRAGVKTHKADDLILQFFKYVGEPNAILLVVEQEESPVGFLFGMAKERMAFLNAAYLILKKGGVSDTIKRECLDRFNDWALSLKCEEGIFTTFRGPYAHQWAEKFGWDYHMTIYHKNYKESP